MASDYRDKVNDIERRMRRRTRLAFFIGASAVHVTATSMLFALQTSCAYPRCVGGIGFEVFRAVMHVPLFVTPWLGLPSPDVDFVRDPALLPLVTVNAALAVALYWAAAVAGYRGYRYGRDRQWEKLRTHATNTPPARR
jgi:hypothetical protein